MSGETEAGRADGDRKRDCDAGAREKAEPGRHVRVLREQRRSVSAGTEEDGLAERDLAGETAQDVPGCPEERVEQHQDHEVLRIWAADDQGPDEDQRGGDQGNDFHCFPSRPRGRARTTIK